MAVMPAVTISLQKQLVSNPIFSSGHFQLVPFLSLSLASMSLLAANKRFEPTAQKLRFWVPSALRAPASAQAAR
jgi:hypothetical protein